MHERAVLACIGIHFTDLGVQKAAHDSQRKALRWWAQIDIWAAYYHLWPNWEPKMILHSKLMIFPKYQHKRTRLFTLDCIDLTPSVWPWTNVLYSQRPCSNKVSRRLWSHLPGGNINQSGWPAKQGRRSTEGQKKTKQSRYYFHCSNCSWFTSNVFT